MFPWTISGSVFSNIIDISVVHNYVHVVYANCYVFSILVMFINFIVASNETSMSFDATIKLINITNKYVHARM